MCMCISTYASTHTHNKSLENKKHIIVKKEKKTKFKERAKKTSILMEIGRKRKKISSQ